MIKLNNVDRNNNNNNNRIINIIDEQHRTMHIHQRKSHLRMVFLFSFVLFENLFFSPKVFIHRLHERRVMASSCSSQCNAQSPTIRWMTLLVHSLGSYLIFMCFITIFLMFVCLFFVVINLILWLSIVINMVFLFTIWNSFLKNNKKRFNGWSFIIIDESRFWYIHLIFSFFSFWNSIFQS